MTRRQMNFALALLAVIIALILWLTGTVWGQGCFELCWDSGPLPHMDPVTCALDTAIGTPDSYGVYINGIWLGSTTDTVYQHCGDEIDRWYYLTSFNGSVETPMPCRYPASRGIWLDWSWDCEYTITRERYASLYEPFDSLVSVQVKLPYGPWNVAYYSEADSIVAWSDWDMVRDGYWDLSDLSLWALRYPDIYTISDLANLGQMVGNCPRERVGGYLKARIRFVWR